MTQSPNDSIRSARLAVGLLLAINLFNYIDRQVLSAVLPKLELDAALFDPADRYLKFKLGWLTTALLALDFAVAVADRLGLLGSAGASWGSWDAFVDYTARMLPFVPAPLVEATAFSATAGEVALAVWLLSGWQRRWAGKAAAGLLAVYLLAMGFAFGPAEVARFALPIQIGGALLVSAVPSRRERTTDGRQPLISVNGQR